MGWITINHRGKLEYTRAGEVIEIKNYTHFVLHSKGDPHVQCSSAIIFPEDYTSDPRVIELCAEILGDEK